MNNLLWPVEGGSSRWPIGDGSDAHLARQGSPAVDIPGPTSGEPALAVAVADCQVTYVEGDGGRSPCGIQVDVSWRTDDKVLGARYCHLASALVHDGQKVAAGQPVGLLGSTGQSTGVHLHFALWVNNTRVRPEDWIDFGGDMLSEGQWAALREHFALIEGCLTLLDEVQATFPARTDPETGEDSKTLGNQGLERLQAVREMLKL